MCNQGQVKGIARRSPGKVLHWKTRL